MDLTRARTMSTVTFGRSVLSTDIKLALALTGFVILFRAPYIGYPEIHVDEQFYLLVGDRMLHGQLPYIDIWDRKPIGLFLLFAGIRLLGGTGYTEYQIVAACFVLATCWSIFLISRRYSHDLAALAAAVVYAAWLSALGGAGGQSPVFYNCLTAIAGLMVLKSLESPSARLRHRWGVGSMTICGIILQLKYTSVAEGIFFGLLLLWHERKLGTSFRMLTLRASLMVGIALMPTVLALAYFAAIGGFDIFVYANFISIFDRLSQPDVAVQANLRTLSFICIPLLVVLPVALLFMTKSNESKNFKDFLTGWLVSALVGFAMIGNFFDHYALPLLVPICIILPKLFDRKYTGPVIFVALIGWALFVAHLRIMPKVENRAMVRQMADQVELYTNSGATLYIDDAPMILYLETGAHAPWRMMFPFHLTDATERNAVGVDTHAEMRRLIAARPGVVLTASAAFTPLVDKTNRKLLDDAIARDYVIVGEHGRPDRRYRINVRRDLAKSPTNYSIGKKVAS